MPGLKIRNTYRKEGILCENLEVIEKIKIAHLILICISWVSFDEQVYQKFEVHEVRCSRPYLQAVFCLSLKRPPRALPPVAR